MCIVDYHLLYFLPDEVREESREAVAMLNNDMGMEVVMITGDHITVATQVCLNHFIITCPFFFFFFFLFFLFFSSMSIAKFSSLQSRGHFFFHFLSLVSRYCVCVSVCLCC